MLSRHLLNFLSLGRERLGVSLQRLKAWEAGQEVHLVASIGSFAPSGKMGRPNNADVCSIWPEDEKGQGIQKTDLTRRHEPGENARWRRADERSALSVGVGRDYGTLFLVGVTRSCSP